MEHIEEFYTDILNREGANFSYHAFNCNLSATSTARPMIERVAQSAAENL
jgi:GTP1/Obg family GTP-binding protein